MQLNEDFIQKLKTHGRLPEPTTNAYFDEIAKVESLSKENQILKEQYEELKKEKATTAEGTILQVDLKKLQVSHDNQDKMIKELTKNEEELKAANSKLEKKDKERAKAL